MTECPENYLGSSNVGISGSFGTRPVGTFAHEMPMVYAGIADATGQDIRASHNLMLRDWYSKYGPDLSTALSDTFTSDFFFEDFTAEQAESWRGVRHDSGDPIEFLDKTEKFYQEKGVDPTVKTIFFSDALDVKAAARIHAAAKMRINDPKGVGTNWTNNVGVKPTNIVMKATHVRMPDGREADTVKLSDNPGKHTGNDALVRRYAETIFNVIEENSHELADSTV
jgi:nicotinate phosphoribosyltransferase